MRKIILILCLLLAGCVQSKNVEYDEKYYVNIGASAWSNCQEGICGGGYTDKYGITWDNKGCFPNCFWEPRICFDCCGSGESEPPENIDENIIFYYKQVINASYNKKSGEKYTGKCEVVPHDKFK